jgi:hypothetical protein
MNDRKEGEFIGLGLLILNEYHYDGKTNIDGVAPCKCSYCDGETKLHYGLNIPGIKSGWWVIKYGDKRYLRITRHHRIKSKPIKYVTGDCRSEGCSVSGSPIGGQVLQG